ncbi:hypothetical protein MES4922_160126 [Mesorhizobium ventifaucium]|uniref:Uncharacterized protein n=1 Tax=Mesorhizobium ventifaucium TaxID=666020 RepID=A0ABN8JHU5_9HYPH|nr:hypothetical protein MES4922_160126 [Mesorhizobium ventifaucium]
MFVCHVLVPKPLRTLGQAQGHAFGDMHSLFMHVVTPKPLRTFGRHAFLVYACRYPKTAAHF